MHYKNIVFPLICLVFIAPKAYPQSEQDIPVRYGVGLTETGSDKPAHTIFTNPGQDCATSVNISWASPSGTECYVELFNEDEFTSYLYPAQEPRFCTTFDNIYSKLGDNTNVYESHAFDKHGMTITNLTPDTRYSYRIVTVDSYTGLEEFSDTYRFKTAGGDRWKAAIIGDFHHYSPYWSRLDAAMGMVEMLDNAADGFDWILSTGDQCAWGGSFNFWTELSEQPPYKDYMWACVQGNHDHQDRQNRQSDNFFRDSHNFPDNGYAGQEGVAYWFTYGDVLFLMLNNEAMRTKDSLLPVFDWMTDVVNTNPSKYVVVVEHYQWLIGTDGSSSHLDRFYDMFDRLGVDLAIAGHNHAYIRTHPLRERQPTAPEYGTYYVVAPSSDNSRGRALNPTKANHDIIAKRWSEGPNTIGGMVMDVDPERILMTLYDRDGQIQDQFAVPAKR